MSDLTLIFAATWRSAIGEAADTIEDVLEPYLHRTPRGRIATPLAYQHFGVTAPRISPTGDLKDSLPPG